MNILPVILFLISFISLIGRGELASAMEWVEPVAAHMRRLATPKDPDADAEAQARGALQATIQQHLGPIIAATLRGTRLLNGPYNEDNAFQNDAGVEVISLSITRLEAAGATNNILLLTHEALSIDDLFIRLGLGLTAHNVQVTVAAGFWVKNVTDPALFALVRVAGGKAPRSQTLEIDFPDDHAPAAACAVFSPASASRRNLLDLPPEIVLLILGHMGEFPDLYALWRTCSYLRNSVKEYLGCDLSWMNPTLPMRPALIMRPDDVRPSVIVRMGTGPGKIFRIRAEKGVPVFRLLSYFPRLQILDLGANDVGDEGARTLAGAFPSLTCLRELVLKANSIGVEGARALAGALSRLPQLRILNLGRNQLGAEGARALAGALPSLTCLQRLDLGMNDAGVEGARALAGALPPLTCLRELMLGSNFIGVEGARALAGALPSLTCLEILDLGMNGVGVEGARALAGALPSLTCLQRLDLGGNGVGDEGARALAGAFPSLTCLRELRLGSNFIGVEGARALAGALPHLLELRKLYMGHSYIESAGARALGEALPHVSQLQVLHLSGNFLDNDGVCALAAGLRGLVNLRILSLAQTGITDIGARAVARIGGGLRRLDVAINTINRDVFKELRDRHPDIQIDIGA